MSCPSLRGSKPQFSPSPLFLSSAFDIYSIEKGFHILTDSTQCSILMSSFLFFMFSVPVVNHHMWPKIALIIAQPVTVLLTCTINFAITLGPRRLHSSPGNSHFVFLFRSLIYYIITCQVEFQLFCGFLLNLFLCQHRNSQLKTRLHG